MTRAPIVFASLVLLGCGSSMPPDGDAPVSDTGAADQDMDGVLAARDCDDMDPAVSAMASRACSNMCGAGTESCTDGIWGRCSAPTDCVCTTEGEMRVGTCGMCGMQSQRCTGGVWTGVSSCLGEGVCVPASVESRATLRCGTQERLCADSCTWGDWFQAAPDGECLPGSSRECPDPAMSALIQACGDDCRYGGRCF